MSITSTRNIKMRRSPLRLPRLAALPLAALLLTGCASLSGNGGAADATRLVSARTGQDIPLSATTTDESSTALIQPLLQQPLSAESAVRIALHNSPALKASLAELGIAEAELVQTGRLHNPSFSFGRVRGGGETEIDRSVTFDLAGLLTMPARLGIERRRFEQAKLQAASHAVQLAHDTRRAYFMAVSAAQSAAFADQVRQAAEASATLADRMRAAGNWSRLDQLRERAFYDDAVTQQARALHAALAAREQLVRLLGLSKAQFSLPDRLPDLPTSPVEPSDAESQALSQRLDVLMARSDAQATADTLGLTRTTRFINVFDAGYANQSSTGVPRKNGYEVSLELPLFDWGGAKVARAEAAYMQAVHRTADAAVRARSEVREAHSAYRSAYDIARHYRDHVIPQRKQISNEVLLRYNGMLANVFELLADAREQLTSVNMAIETQRDFWIAETNLQSALHGAGQTDSRSKP